MSGHWLQRSEGVHRRGTSALDYELRACCRGRVVRLRTLFITMVFVGLLGACQRSLPPLVDAATSQGGVSYDCEQDVIPELNPTFARSPEMNQRLREHFPRWSRSQRLRAALVRQGFQLQGHCSPDRSISWARFRRGGDRVARIYWREDKNGRLVWTFGDVEFGLTRAIAIKPNDHSGFRAFDRLIRVLRGWATT